MSEKAHLKCTLLIKKQCKLCTANAVKGHSEKEFEVPARIEFIARNAVETIVNSSKFLLNDSARKAKMEAQVPKLRMRDDQRKRPMDLSLSSFEPLGVREKGKTKGLLMKHKGFTSRMAHKLEGCSQLRKSASDSARVNDSDG